MTASTKLKIAFDTSVLVAGLVEAHPEFKLAWSWLDAAAEGRIDAVWCTHAYAETWSVLTRLPLPTRLDPAIVNQVLDALTSTAAPAPLVLADYQHAASRCVAAGVRSGAIFDALHLVAAERLSADALLTFNVKDFTRLSPRIQVLEPPASLGLPVG